MADEHYIIEVRIKHIHWAAPPMTSSEARYATPVPKEKHDDQVLFLVQKADTMEGAITSLQAHLDVVLGKEEE